MGLEAEKYQGKKPTMFPFKIDAKPHKTGNLESSFGDVLKGKLDSMSSELLNNEQLQDIVKDLDKQSKKFINLRLVLMNNIISDLSKKLVTSADDLCLVWNIQTAFMTEPGPS